MAFRSCAKRCGCWPSSCGSSPGINRRTGGLVDLSVDAEVLLPPQAYPDVARPEDRLFVPAEYVPLWEQHGWKRG